jgi:predicted Zn finger-like uncharacterized protein
VQANCPSCSHRIVIDDARVPDRPFSVKCPKCQKAVRFPGKGTAGATRAVRAVAPEAGTPAAPAAGSEPGTAPEDAREQIRAQLKKEIDEHKEQPKTGEKALVALPDMSQAGTATVTLTRAGYEVETLDDWEDATRLLDRASFDIVVTTHAVAATGGYNPYQKIVRMPAEDRRRICLIVVAPDLTTNDAGQAFKLQADMVINVSDLGGAGAAIREVVFDRRRVYQALHDAIRRMEAT